MSSRKPCVIIGCGGHSTAVISIVESTNEFEILGLLDNAQSYDSTESKNGYRVISTLNQFIEDDDKSVSCIIAIGDNSLRNIIYNKLSNLGFELPNVIAGSAIVSRSSTMGSANIIGHGTVLNADVRIGDNNLINTHAILEHHSQIANDCHIAPGAVICGAANIESLVFLGANSVVLPNKSVARTFTLGAGSVLTKNIIKKSLTYAGVPAKELKT